VNCVTMFAMRVGGHVLAVSFHFTGSPPGALCTTGVLATAYLGRHGMDRFDCCICRHSCQLAAVVCNCSKERVACLRHFSQVQMCVGIVASSAASPTILPHQLCHCPNSAKCFVSYCRLTTLDALIERVARRRGKLQRRLAVRGFSRRDATVEKSHGCGTYSARMLTSSPTRSGSNAMTMPAPGLVEEVISRRM